MTIKEWEAEVMRRPFEFRPRFIRVSEDLAVAYWNECEKYVKGSTFGVQDGRRSWVSVFYKGDVSRDSYLYLNRYGGPERPELEILCVENPVVERRYDSDWKKYFDHIKVIIMNGLGQEENVEFRFTSKA